MICEDCIHYRVCENITDPSMRKIVNGEEVEKYCAAFINETDIALVVRCKDCEWWTKQQDSAQGRCELMGIYPTGYWYCGNGRKGE